MTASKLFRLRAEVHVYLDPIWREAAQTGGYTRREIRKYAGPAAYYFEQSARCRVYGWLAEQMLLTVDECHAAKFTAAQCRQAIDLLAGVTFAEIRQWAARTGFKVRRRYDLVSRDAA
ncbi:MULTISPECIES: hypothetical protein [unclassified Methylobacterium]|uniref:hypothetical protein n=1 Tax=unclassified Methylobacterium TaxID=2615210 RepID=UPI002269836E|nr:MULTISPECIES: hypothetical protein [unclassified Methylobacterium]